MTQFLNPVAPITGRKMASSLKTLRLLPCHGAFT
jgi:hypothetical protein